MSVLRALIPQPPNLTQSKDGHPMAHGKLQGEKLLTLWWVTDACYTSICTARATTVAVAVNYWQQLLGASVNRDFGYLQEPFLNFLVV